MSDRSGRCGYGSIQDLCWRQSTRTGRWVGQGEARELTWKNSWAAAPVGTVPSLRQCMNFECWQQCVSKTFSCSLTGTVYYAHIKETSHFQVCTTQIP